MSCRLVFPAPDVISSRRPGRYELPAINPDEHGSGPFLEMRVLVDACVTASRRVLAPTEPDLLDAVDAQALRLPVQCACGRIDVLRHTGGRCRACGSQIGPDGMLDAVQVVQCVGALHQRLALRLVLDEIPMLCSAADRRRWLAYEAMAREGVVDV